MLQRIVKKIIVLLLTVEARLIIRKYRPKIIAITGSVGKTGTKDAIYTVLRGTYSVWRSERSYNSELGVPLSILGRESGWRDPRVWTQTLFYGASLILFRHEYPSHLVLEIGVDRRGDMRRLVSWLSPDIVVLTKFPDIPPHVEFFSSPQELHEEKWKLAKAVKDDGIIIINADDAALRNFQKRLDAVRVITFGFSDSSDVRARDEHILFSESNGHQIPRGLSCTIQYGNEESSLVIQGTIASNYIGSALAGIAVAMSLGISLPDAVARLAGFEVPPGRSRILSGIRGSLVIDDSYNSSPEAVSVALLGLSRIEGVQRKIAVLGDMLELGRHTLEAHRRVGEEFPQGIDSLYLVGPRAHYIAEGVAAKVLRKQKIHFYPSAQAAAIDLKKKIKKGDMVLIKGSQGIRMEKIVAEILEKPDEKGHLLVRQGVEWTRG